MVVIPLPYLNAVCRASSKGTLPVRSQCKFLGISRDNSVCLKKSSIGPIVEYLEDWYTAGAKEFDDNIPTGDNCAGLIPPEAADQQAAKVETADDVNHPTYA